MNLNKLIISSLICLLASGCVLSSSETSSEEPITEPTTPEVVIDTNNETMPEQLLISSEGIGDAKIGMSYKDLQTLLGESFEFEVISPFMVDLDAIAVSQNDKIQYYILYFAGEPFKETDKIEILMTDNPNYSTIQRVGVGTSIKEAENIYGQAKLFYNINNESREYVEFANQPFTNIYFRPRTDKGDFAGIYNEPRQEYNQTNTFEDDATIRSIQIVQQNN